MSKRTPVPWLLLALVLYGSGPSAALAQSRSLVGSWSAQTTDTQGRVTGTIFSTFRGDGSFAQRWVVPRITIDYTGGYRQSQDGSTVQWTYRDYHPKTDCRWGSCMPVVSAVRMNVPLTTYIRWVSTNVFITEDASGPVRWVRQQ
jgi:hypothetical protein